MASYNHHSSFPHDSYHLPFNNSPAKTLLDDEALAQFPEGAGAAPVSNYPHGTGLLPWPQEAPALPSSAPLTWSRDLQSPSYLGTPPVHNLPHETGSIGYPPLRMQTPGEAQYGSNQSPPSKLAPTSAGIQQYPNTITFQSRALRGNRSSQLQIPSSSRHSCRDSSQPQRVTKRSTRMGDKSVPQRALQPRQARPSGASIRLLVDDGGSDGAEFVELYRFCKPFQDSEGSFPLSLHDLREFFTTSKRSSKASSTKRTHRGLSSSIPTSTLSDAGARPRTTHYVSDGDQKIARCYRSYQKEFRLKDNGKGGLYKCTLGCSWSHKKKGNWERHERSHYPPEIWLCRHPGCQDKSQKTRVSFRKDLIKRHYRDHHKANPSDVEIERCKILVRSSRFPKQCIFDNCSQRFETFDERSSHVEAHLRRLENFDARKVKKFHASASLAQTPKDDLHDVETLRSGGDGGSTSNHEAELSEDNVSELSEEDSEEDEDWQDRNDEQDPDPGCGAGGSASNLPGQANLPPTGGTYGAADQLGDGGFYSDTGSGFSGYTMGLNSIAKQPWRTMTALRLQLLPQVMAHGIYKTPLVLKKIQLQAALALEAAGAKQAQVVEILFRELSTMLRSLIRMSAPQAPLEDIGTGLTRMKRSTIRSLLYARRESRAYQSQSTLGQFGGLKQAASTATAQMVMPEASDGLVVASSEGSQDYPTSNLYQCSPGAILGKNTPMLRPSRLIHVGSITRPILHLDVSDTLPVDVEYCSLSHCWDSGPGLQLTHENFSKLQRSIPLERLPMIFQNAVKCSREMGLEYLWIDSLCIIQDSMDDWRCELPKMDYIYARASYTIVITTSLLGARVGEESLGERQAQTGDLERESVSSALHHSAPALTSDIPDSEETDSMSFRTSLADRQSLKAWDTWTLEEKHRRPSHQLWVSVFYLIVHVSSTNKFPVFPGGK